MVERVELQEAEEDTFLLEVEEDTLLLEVERIVLFLLEVEGKTGAVLLVEALPMEALAALLVV